MLFKMAILYCPTLCVNGIHESTGFLILVFGRRGLGETVKLLESYLTLTHFGQQPNKVPTYMFASTKTVH